MQNKITYKIINIIYDYFSCYKEKWGSQGERKYKGENYKF